jgi:LPXTG-motif cell wall-anchored protein
MLAQGGPPGPDLCYLLGFCQTSAGISSSTNLLFLSSVLILAGVVLYRSRKRRKE